MRTYTRAYYTVLYCTVLYKAVRLPVAAGAVPAGGGVDLNGRRWLRGARRVRRDVPQPLQTLRRVFVFGAGRDVQGACDRGHADVLGRQLW
jgi:hypothetical protein